MIFKCSNITFSYPETADDVFRNLSLTVTQPGFHAIFGASGVGKTSFAKIITGETQGFSGEISTENMHTFLYTYNLEKLPGWSSVQRHIDKVTPVSKNGLKQELIDVFGIQEYMQSRFSQLSLGQQNRVNLLRYLLQDFDMLVMDESLANVDELTRENIILKIKELFPGACFFYISHNAVEVSRFCKQIFIFGDVDKHPQVQMVNGLDFSTGQTIEKKDMDAVLLEMMNAS